MAFDVQDCTLFGPALPAPFVKFQLENELNKAKLLPKNSGAEGKELQRSWEVLRRKLNELSTNAGAVSVKNHVLEPLVERLEYTQLVRSDEVSTREGAEDGGWILTSADKSSTLRAWACASDTDLDAPSQRGHAYRFSPSRVAQRVLLAKGERVGLLTDGEELRILICDPARPESHVSIPLAKQGGWRGKRDAPDSYRLLLALSRPKGVLAVPKLTESARLAQTGVTKKLREQARRAVESFVQELLDHADNRDRLDAIASELAQSGAHASAQSTARSDREHLARELWKEGLVLVYRLLFVLKLESSSDPARSFSFASTDFWRESFSPNRLLATHARAVLDEGLDTGRLLEDSLRALFRLFSDGLSASGIRISPLGGMLFGANTTPVIDRLAWGERAVAHLIDNLLWTPGDGRVDRERVHYGALDVEDLGRVYEALLELEPGITTEPMCRLKRAKLEVVLPIARGERYRTERAESADSEDEEEPEEEDGEPRRGSRTRVQWVEEIPPGRFFLRVGLGRKATGSYYTPHPFVRFLVQETLGPQVLERSPATDPNPSAILALKVLDPAMGSGHFLVEACRFLGERLYESCRLCDELAVVAEEQAAKDAKRREELLARATELRKRVEALPDPADELVRFLPSRVVEGTESGFSQRHAEALCRRLIAVHCLYGVDKNPLAVELAKLVLWLESYAEGMPLTFLDHRLLPGDSLTGPFFEQMLKWPVSGQPVTDVLAPELGSRLKARLGDALEHVRDLESTIGKDVADLELKRIAKEKLDATLAPFRTLARAWTGAVMRGEPLDDRQYERVAEAIGRDDAAPEADEAIASVVAVGKQCLPYDLVFPEVFHRDGELTRSGGFDAVLGNPPWDAIQFKSKEFLAGFDLDVFEAPTKHERAAVEARLTARPEVGSLFEEQSESFERLKRANDALFEHQKVFIDGDLAGRYLDAFRVFLERMEQVTGSRGSVGVVVPSAFHANAGATGVRQLYLEKMELDCCYSFENRRKLFEIDSRQKFAVVVARKSHRGTREFSCAFYVHDLDWLFSDSKPLRYTLDFVKKTGGEYLTFLELRSATDAEVAKVLFSARETFGGYCRRVGIRFGVDCNMTLDSHRFVRTDDLLALGEDPRDPDVAERLRDRGYLPLHEGKTFHQYTDHWEDRPRYCVAIEKLASKAWLLDAPRYPRLAFRDIASSTNERTAIFTLVPPGVLFGHTAACERSPEQRSIASALVLLAIVNSFTFDWCLRQKSSAHVSPFLLDGLPMPSLSEDARACLCRLAAALSMSSCTVAMLGVTDQGADPVARRGLVDSDKEVKLRRFRVRCQIDAIVAKAFGLSRQQFAFVLTGFSHSSAPSAPIAALAAFDELDRMGLEAFCKARDPYWDVGLSMVRPSPVLDLLSLLTPAEIEPDGPAYEQLSLIGDETRPVGGALQVADALSEHSGNGMFERLLQLLRVKGSLTTADAQVATGLNGSAIRIYLDRLVQGGYAMVENRRHGARYRLVKSIDNRPRL